ncbi:MAG: hypothetical protein IJP61_11975 [Treponema sp.]|jgi:hypothetical protein|nr:hypothetical protein [Treponema sp.]
MSIVEKLKKKSLDQKLFVAGMLLTFIGLVLPCAFNVPDWVSNTSPINVFVAARALNLPGSAYNATFIIVLWLASLAGICTFLLSSSIVSEALVWFIGAGFGIASIITLPPFLEVTPVVGYANVGCYIAFVGWVLAFVAWVIGASKVKQAEIRKEI